MAKQPRQVAFVKAQILMELNELFLREDYNISQHLYHILHCKQCDPYQWEDKDLLVVIKKYSDKIVQEELD